MTELELREIVFRSAEYEVEVALRDAVLRQPLGLALNQEELAMEGGQIHLGAFLEGKLAACLVLVPSTDESGHIKMRQVAVNESFRGRGFGQALVQFAETISRERGFRWMKLHARKTAVEFYLKMAYTIEGDEFEEVGIPHLSMSKHL